LATDESIKGNITELYFNQNKSIREIARTIKKSSRDIVAVLKESGDKENKHSRNIIAIPRHTDEGLPLNIKAYKLLSKGRSLMQTTIELKLTAQQAQQFNTEYWKLMQLDQLFMIYQEIKNNLGYFLKLFRLGKKEGLTPEKIINLLNIANIIQDLNEQFQFHLSEVKNMELRKSRCKEQLEDLENKTISAKEQLFDTERAFKHKFGELSGICSHVRMLEYEIEQFKNSQSYQAIEQAAKVKVNELLNDNKRLLQYALVSVIDALRNEHDRYLLFDKIPVADTINHSSLGSIFYQGDFQFVKEKVLEIADNLFGKLRKGLVDSSLSSLLTTDWKREIYIQLKQ
jgi:hypothetical protein